MNYYIVLVLNPHTNCLIIGIRFLGIELNSSATCISATNLIYGVFNWKNCVDPQKSSFIHRNAT